MTTDVAEIAHRHGAGEDVSARRDGHALRITLTRQKALNALTHVMCLALHELLAVARDDDQVALVILEASEGRAFCAGGDVKSVWQARQEGGNAWRFFHDEYRMNAELGLMTKPVVSMVDGIVMGGGVGISVHGSHRIVTENTMFAMPETAIGLFPDVGSSHALPRFRFNAGLWLALTGERINGADCMAVGYGTHFVLSEHMAELGEALATSGDVDGTLSMFATTPPEAPVLLKRQEIETVFTDDDFGALYDRLRAAADTSEHMARALKAIDHGSPVSVLVTHEMLRRGAKIPDIRECLAMEFDIVSRILDGDDLYEGIAAALVRKDRSPHWSRGSWREVGADEIAAHFETSRHGRLTFPHLTGRRS